MYGVNMYALDSRLCSREPKGSNKILNYESWVLYIPTTEHLKKMLQLHCNFPLLRTRLGASWRWWGSFRHKHIAVSVCLSYNCLRYHCGSVWPPSTVEHCINRVNWRLGLSSELIRSLNRNLVLLFIAVLSSIVRTARDFTSAQSFPPSDSFSLIGFLDRDQNSILCHKCPSSRWPRLKPLHCSSQDLFACGSNDVVPLYKPKRKTPNHKNSPVSATMLSISFDDRLTALSVQTTEKAVKA